VGGKRKIDERGRMRGASDGSNQAEFSAKREELGARDSLDVLTSLPQPSSFRSGLELGACPFVDLKFNRCKSTDSTLHLPFPDPCLHLLVPVNQTSSIAKRLLWAVSFDI
jgi:hypothetical protein